MDWLIKRNLRREDVQAWLKIVREKGQEETSREGKTVWRGATHRIPDQLPCTEDAFVLRSLQSLGGTLAESLSEFYDPCHVGGKARGYFRHDLWTIS